MYVYSGMELRLRLIFALCFVAIVVPVTTMVAQKSTNLQLDLDYLRLEGKENKGLYPKYSYVLEDKIEPFHFYRFSKEVQVSKLLVEKVILSEYELKLNSSILYEIPESLLWFSEVSTHRKKAFTSLFVYPFIKENGSYYKITQIGIDYKQTSNRSYKNARSLTWKSTSVLANGNVYKIGVLEDGVYSLTTSFLSSMGINISGVNPDEIQVYGAPAGMIQKDNDAIHFDDLEELSVLLNHNGDASFESGESVLFFGQGVDQWEVSESGDYQYIDHFYADTNYYFVRINQESSKKMTVEPISAPADTAVLYTDHLQIHENNWTNLIQTGSRWLGESFEFDLDKRFSFSVENPSPVYAPQLKIATAARATSGTNLFNVSVNGEVYSDLNVPNVSGVYYSDYVKAGISTYTLNNNYATVQVDLTYSKPQSNSLAWLDYITLRTKAQINISSKAELCFVDAGYGNTISYEIKGSVSQVWDVTDINNVFVKDIILSNGITTFTGEQDVLRKYLAIGSSYKIPLYIEKVQNQDLHSLSNVDYIIVCPPKFQSEANRLADFHEQNGLSVEVVSPEQVYNEFSSGVQDVMGIRKFLKMLYDRAGNEDDMPKYLLLFGDGSYDPKYRIDDNTNQVICYQSPNSYQPTQSYVSDDFFVLLDDSEGEWDGLNETIDMGVGRFPINTLAEAKALVDKSISYGSASEDNLGEWRNEIVFVADDEDGNTHNYQANYLSNKVNELYPNFNSKKIFFDTYPQESGAGGDLYPEVNDAINQSFQNGALIINYTGHGGEVGWAHERVLGFSDINLWDNTSKLPLLMTATCEFSRYDNPSLISAGEAVLLSSKGGSIALFTTVRLVFSSPNFVLNQHFYDNLLDTSNFEPRRLGDIYRLTKRASGGATNHRNFTLLGDPALLLASPEREVVTTSINGYELGANDTIQSLSVVSISGEVWNSSGQVDQNFNGTLVPTIFDKASSMNTLANDGGDPFTFDSQESIIFKGNVSVVSGRFTFQFMVPKDISFNEGFGKISYYVQNGVEDGNGSYSNLVISGTSDSVILDNVGPEIDLHMNDELFVDGGLTNESPLLLVSLLDSSGINTVGNGIGHDITAILNGKSSEAIVLNDYYQSDLDSYQSGNIEYQFFDLPEGNHQLLVKAWDVHNNSSERMISFEVQNRESLSLSNVLNYPNPFTSNTSFYFDHNQINESLEVKVVIMTVSGRVVKTLHNSFTSDSFKGEVIPWDGKDTYGSELARGIYVYSFAVSNSSGETVSQMQKLVVLK